MATTYLDEIMAWHRARAGSTAASPALLDAARTTGPVRSLSAALRSRFGVIAEFKRRSPSKGMLASDGRSPGEAARAYQAGGAAAVSVLTDEEFFGARTTDLEEVADVAEVPVLRKDFLVTPPEVVVSRVRGADAVLVIASALSPAEVEALIGTAAEVGLEVLLEVHSARELDGIDLDGCGFSGVLGVNQRDLVTFEVDRSRAEAVIVDLPSTWPRVAESGITGATDVARLAEAGFDGVLVGELLMRADDPAVALAGLVEAGQRVREDLRHHQPR